MRELNKFLSDIISGNNIDRFWDEYRGFCDKIENIDITQLIQIIPPLVTRIEEKKFNTYQLYDGIGLACSKSVEYAEKLYAEILTRPEDYYEKALGNIISGLYKNDPESAVKKVKKLLEYDDTGKLVQGISSIAHFDFDKHPSKDFMIYLHDQFSQLIQNTHHVDVYASILFVCRRKRGYLFKSNEHVLALLNNEEPLIKIHLIDILNYSVDVKKERDFYKTVLDSIVSLDVSYIGYYNSLDYMLSKLVKDDLDLVDGFLNIWITCNTKNPKQIRLFDSVFNKIYDDSPTNLQNIITNWLNSDNSSFHITIFNLCREISYGRIALVGLSESLLKKYSFYDIEFIVFKIIGFVYDREVSTTMLYSILNTRYENSDIVSIMEWVFVDYLIFNYYSTINFLKERRKNAPLKLKNVIDHIILSGEKLYSVYSDLEALKEFQPSRERLRYMDKIQNKKFQKEQEEYEKNDTSFLSQVASLHFRAGKKAFGKFGGAYSQEMEPKLYSQEGELPRGESIDPTGQAVLRIESQNFKRRK